MSRRRQWLLVIVSALAAGIGGSVVIVGLLPDPSASRPPAQVAVTSGPPIPAPVGSLLPPSPAALTARAVADQLANLYPLPNLRDNTGYARDAGVVEAITTDAVTVLKFASEAQAQKWVESFKRSGAADVRRAGVFVLSWAAKDTQDWTSSEARAAMHKELQRLVSA